jgi:hypothetical protein
LDCSIATLSGERVVERARRGTTSRAQLQLSHYAVTKKKKCKLLGEKISDFGRRRTHRFGAQRHMDFGYKTGWKAGRKNGPLEEISRRFYDPGAREMALIQVADGQGFAGRDFDHRHFRNGRPAMGAR